MLFRSEDQPPQQPAFENSNKYSNARRTQHITKHHRHVLDNSEEAGNRHTYPRFNYQDLCISGRRKSYPCPLNNTHNKWHKWCLAKAVS